MTDKQETIYNELSALFEVLKKYESNNNAYIEIGIRENEDDNLYEKWTLVSESNLKSVDDPYYDPYTITYEQYLEVLRDDGLDYDWDYISIDAVIYHINISFRIDWVSHFVKGFGYGLSASLLYQYDPDHEHKFPYANSVNGINFENLRVNEIETFIELNIEQMLNQKNNEEAIVKGKKALKIMYMCKENENEND